MDVICARFNSPLSTPPHTLRVLPVAAPSGTRGGTRQDYIFKPGMQEGGALASLLGPLFGVGASRGIGVLISLVGLLSVGVAVAAFFIPRIRRVELDLPDHDQLKKLESTPAD